MHTLRTLLSLIGIALEAIFGRSRRKRLKPLSSQALRDKHRAINERHLRNMRNRGGSIMDLIVLIACFGGILLVVPVLYAITVIVLGAQEPTAPW